MRGRSVQVQPRMKKSPSSRGAASRRASSTRAESSSGLFAGQTAIVTGGVSGLGLSIARRIVVAHAGIGTILSAQKARKPIVVMARRAARREHRNDHQVATCAQLQGRRGLYVADDAADLRALLSGPPLQPLPAEDYPERAVLLANLRSYLRTREQSRAGRTAG